MAIIDSRALQEQLKKGTLSNLYYFYGSDVLQVDACVKQVMKATGDPEPASMSACWRMKQSSARCLQTGTVSGSMI